MGKQEKPDTQGYTLTVTERALDDIDAIVDFIAHGRFQPLNAIRVGNALFATIARIAINPLKYRTCEEIPTKGKLYRKATCYKWFVIFKVKTHHITVLGVIHGSRRPSRIRTLVRKPG